MNPLAKTGLTHAGTAAAAAYATFAFLADNKADLYALWDQLNVVIAQMSKFIAMLTPIATAGYGIWRTTAGVRIAEVANDPKAVEAAKALPVTPTTSALADALKKG